MSTLTHNYGTYESRCIGVNSSVHIKGNRREIVTLTLLLAARNKSLRLRSWGNANSFVIHLRIAKSLCCERFLCTTFTGHAIN